MAAKEITAIGELFLFLYKGEIQIYFISRRHTNGTSVTYLVPLWHTFGLSTSNLQAVT